MGKNCRNLRWLWTTPTEFFKTLPKNAPYHSYQKLIIHKYIKDKFTVPFLNYKGVFSRSYCCHSNPLRYKDYINVSPMVRQLFDTMIVASSDKEPPQAYIWWLLIWFMVCYVSMVARGTLTGFLFYFEHSCLPWKKKFRGQLWCINSMYQIQCNNFVTVFLPLTTSLQCQGCRIYQSRYNPENLCSR